MSDETSFGDEVKRAPFPSFNFSVDFYEDKLPPANGAVPTNNGKPVPICTGVFSECTGIDATMEPKVIKEGGRNYGANQRVGQVTFSTVILKRGMTSTAHLWKWWSLVAGGKYAFRLSADITIFEQDGTPAVGFTLERVLPVKFKAPDLNAMTGNAVAIEELHLAHEGLRRWL
ncbi:MAG TPA: phage tail protein [Polyangia bacterium]|nr:phage tail protein [Polyangia bacterium]